MKKIQILRNEVNIISYTSEVYCIAIFNKFSVNFRFCNVTLISVNVVSVVICIKSISSSTHIQVNHISLLFLTTLINVSYMFLKVGCAIHMSRTNYFDIFLSFFLLSFYLFCASFFYL